MHVCWAERFPLWMCPPGCLPGASDRLADQQRPQLLRHPQSRSGNTEAKTEAYKKEQQRWLTRLRTLEETAFRWPSWEGRDSLGKEKVGRDYREGAKLCRHNSLKGSSGRGAWWEAWGACVEGQGVWERRPYRQAQIKACQSWVWI